MTSILKKISNNKYIQQLSSKIMNIYIESKQIKKNHVFWFSIYFSIFFSLFYNPLLVRINKVTKFNRIIGMGIISDVDVTKRIRNFSVWFFIFSLCFILFYMFINYLKSRIKVEDKENIIVMKFLDNFIILANIELLFRVINYFKTNIIFSYSSYFTMLIIVMALVYICCNLKKNITAETYMKIMILGLVISYPISILINMNEIVLLNSQIVIFIFMFLVVKFCVKKRDNNIIEIIGNSGILTIVFIPVLTSFFIELINILNQHNIFVSDPKKWYIVMLTLVMLIFLIGIFVIKSKKMKFKNWKKWTYPSLVLGMVCLSVQLPLQSVYNPDIFESANSSVLISDFLNYGTIPIVEHFGGHMMTDVWEGIVYGILNKDIAGAAFSPYSVYFIVVLSMLFYYFIKDIWNEEMALFTTLLFPFYDFWKYFGLGILIYFAIKSYIKKNSYNRSVLLWLTLIWCILYRMDLGYAFSLATIVTLLFYIIRTKNWRSVRYLIYSLIGTVTFCIIIWFIICISKKIDPIYRLKEFLKISLSNQNWAYDTIGNTKNIVFVWVYMLLPFTMAVCLICTIFSKKMYNSLGNKKWILLIFLGFSYFANFSRGLVRHSLAEHSAIDIITWTAYIFLAIFVSYFNKNRKYFLPIFTFLILFNTLFFKGDVFNKNIIINSVNLKINPIINTWNIGKNNEKTIWQKLREKKKRVNRVILDSKLKNETLKYSIIINTLLEKNETFVDFINKSLLYSILNKKDPVYVSQSPLQLSGEFTQNEFIKQIDGIPIVLMPSKLDDRSSITLDGISNNYRYYKVVEYIYQNYEPLIKYDDTFSVWCLKTHCERLRNKAKSLVEQQEYVQKFLDTDSLILNNIELIKENETVKIKSIGVDPIVAKLESFIDLKKYIGKKAKITIDYVSDIEGEMQIFYTTKSNEEYSNDKVITTKIFNKGKAEFVIPVTEFTKVRLDIPEKSIVNLNSFKVGTIIDYIDYGYDEFRSKEENTYSYINALHNYSVRLLPLIWANYDVKKSINNKVLTVLTDNNGVFSFNNIFNLGKKGNYLLISTTYEGLKDTENVIIKLGSIKNDIFDEKYQYVMTVKKGRYDYLIRVSTDYYWYLNQINAVKIISNKKLKNTSMKILEGD